MIIGKAIYPGPKLPQDEDLKQDRVKRLGEAHVELHSIFASGSPIFTRDDIQDVSRQLRDLKGKSGSVSIRALNGTRVDVAIQTGHVVANICDTEHILELPFIHYASLQELTTIDRRLSIPRLAYCSLRIYHYITCRNKFTKEEVMFPRPPDDNIRVVPKPTPRWEGSEYDFFKSCQSQWEKSKPCKELISIIQSIDVLADIKQIVAFGLGSITHDLHPDRATPRSSFQHSLILTLRSVLGEKQKHQDPVSCYVQDPVYVDVDRLILEDHGITILDDPDGFLKLDDSTLVISCAPQIPVKQITMDLARPAAMIWNGIQEHDDDRFLWADPDSDRIRRIINESYNIFEIPGNTENFSDVALYVRRT